MIGCAFLGHGAVDPRKAWHDRLSFRGSCPRCDAPLVQDATTGVWSRFASADFDVRRTGRPDQPRHDDVWRR